MAGERLEEFAPVNGEEFRPAFAKLWAMLLAFLFMVPGGALAAFLWWFQIELPDGMVLSAKAGIVGLAVMPLAILLSLVIVALLASAKRLIIAENCVQLLSGKRVVVHIPYQNVAETYATGEANAGVVGLKLHDRKDSATLVPSWTKDRYEIQVLPYRKSLDYIHKALVERLAEFRAGSRLAGPFSTGHETSRTHGEQDAAAHRQPE